MDYRWMAPILMIVGSAWIGEAHAELPKVLSREEGHRTYEVTGRVTDLSKDKIVLRSGDELYELRREGVLTRIPDGVRAGDVITLQYTEEAQQAYPVPGMAGIVPPNEAKERKEKSGEQPGEAAPKPQTDDRIFFNASNVGNSQLDA